MNEMDPAVPRETPLFFARGPERLFGVLHEPAASPRTLGFVMSHPFSEEKLWSHRVFVSFARALARRGHPVLRFDYTGAGDSSGAASEISLRTCHDDLRAAIGELNRRRPGLRSVGLIGLRLGASIAAGVAEEADQHEAARLLQGAPLILWEPVIDGLAYFQEVLRSNLSTQLAVHGKVIESREQLQEKLMVGLTVNVDGYELGRPLFESCSAAPLLPLGAARHTGPTLIVHIAQSAQAPVRADLREAARSFPHGSLARVTEHPFWRETKPFYGRAVQLADCTIAWLETHDA